MGISQNKDEFIDIYMSTNRQYYIAGDLLQGEIYLNVKSNRNYVSLCIRLDGLEYVYWTTGTGRNRTSYRSRYVSYEGYCLIADFGGQLKAGQYVFPFSLLLPAMMPSSFVHSQSCYIQYMLKAQLLHPTSQAGTQRYHMFLNILEPPRMQIGPISMSSKTSSQCCGCCTDYGAVGIVLRADRNFVTDGERVGISGVIDNTGGKVDIGEWGVQFQQRRIMISSESMRRCLTDVQIIRKGKTHEFSLQALIPQVNTYTAIGRVVARYFLLRLYTDYGCCTSTAEAVLHIIVHSRTPVIVEKGVVPKPVGWDPRVFPKVECRNMRPYVYAPHRLIPFLNMPGASNISVVNNGQSDEIAQNYAKASTDWKPNVEGHYMGYNPVFHSPNIMGELDQEQKGQKGQQPYFKKNDSLGSNKNFMQSMETNL